MMRKLLAGSAITLILSALLIFSTFASAQNITYARQTMDTLSSPAMFGRGYVNNGCNIAAGYLACEMKRLGLSAYTPGYKQEFKVDVKTYPSDMYLEIDGKCLKPGQDFTVMAGSPSMDDTFRLLRIDSSDFRYPKRLERIKKKNLHHTMMVYNRDEMHGKYGHMADSLLHSNYLGCAGFIILTHKNSIAWSVNAPENGLPYPVLTVLSKQMPDKPKYAGVKITLESIADYPVSNVIGFIPGTTQPDSFMVITAHYDHLGMMGNSTCFAGANDNASGTAMMLDLAAHYMQDADRPAFSMVFIALAGEEIGLKGSNFNSEHPLFPLSGIRFLINLDMVGTGSEGITMVNAEQFPLYYDRLVKINADNEYLRKVAKRGESCNSDHCPYYKKGVPATFIYSMGKEYLEYHNIQDQAQRVPLTEYEDIFRLLRDFINTF